MMASYETVNYSLRPSKSIERQIVFEGVRQIHQRLGLKEIFYVGMGSIWFSDFVMAHKILGIDDMLSMEKKEVGYRRAVFNAPFATVRVKEGASCDILPGLCLDKKWKFRPWLAWLDYDGRFDETVREDLRTLLEKCPQNSILLLTFNGHEFSYGAHPEQAVERLKDLFGSVVPDDLRKEAVKGARMQQTLADFSLEFMCAVTGNSSRPGGFLPAFRLLYEDNAPMVTVGGVLPGISERSGVEAVVSADGWACRPKKVIKAPHLTMREAAVLQSQLPCAQPLSREIVKKLGFDLEEEQIETFQQYYRQYPFFAQIVT